jgi:hypothetical protein
MSQNIEAVHLDKHTRVHGIEFVGAINKNGHLTDYRTINGLRSSEEQKEIFSMSVIFYQSVHDSFDDNFGAVKYTITEREDSSITLDAKWTRYVSYCSKWRFFLYNKKVLDDINHIEKIDMRYKKI